MSFRNLNIVAALSALVLVAAMIFSPAASACSRVLYTSKDGKYVLVGRNMDWLEDMRSNLWVMPRGIKRDGMATKNSVTWTAKFGSVIVSGYDVGSAARKNCRGAPRRRIVSSVPPTTWDGYQSQGTSGRQLPASSA